MVEKSSEIQRRSPMQARSRATRDAILEAASQILEREGAAGFNTNAVADRAGVSIGTLYQYFPGKAAILVTVAKHEAEVAEPRLAGRHKALLKALAAFLESFRLGGATPRANGIARVAKSRRRRGSVIVRLQWAPPAPWPMPWLTPIAVKAHRRRR